MGFLVIFYTLSFIAAGIEGLQSGLEQCERISVQPCVDFDVKFLWCEGRTCAVEEAKWIRPKPTARKFNHIISSCAHPLAVLLLHHNAVFEQLHQLGRKQQTFILGWFKTPSLDVKGLGCIPHMLYACVEWEYSVSRSVKSYKHNGV